MSENIIWTLDVQVAGGPKQSLAQAITVDAYDVININIPAADGGTPTQTKVAAVQPSASGKVQFLLITSTAYDATGKLVYYVDAAKKIDLGAPQVLIGAKVTDLLGAPLQNITVENQLLQPVSVSLLVGRNAT